MTRETQLALALIQARQRLLLDAVLQAAFRCSLERHAARSGFPLREALDRLTAALDAWARKPDKTGKADTEPAE